MRCKKAPFSRSKADVDTSSSLHVSQHPAISFLSNNRAANGAQKDHESKLALEHSPWIRRAGGGLPLRMRPGTHLFVLKRSIDEQMGCKR